jgi:dTDP-4-dehydrorhamnose reductase
LEVNGRVLVTGAGGQLGAALQEEFAADGVLALTRAEWDVTQPPPSLPDVGLVLHAAAWTNVDGAEDDPQYVESDATNPQSVYGRTKLTAEAAAGEDAWIVRTSWLFGWTSTNFVRTMLRLGAERDEVSVVDDQRGCPTYVGHLAAATRELLELPRGVWHVAADGDCTWAEFAEAIFEEAGLNCRVRRITTAELGRPAPRPANSVLRSERGAPELPHWREGLRACLERLASS